MADRDSRQEETWRTTIEPHIDRVGGLIRAMRALQQSDGYLDPAVHPVLADCFNLSHAEVKGVASFYDDFRDTPPAPHELRICRAEACQAAGGGSLVRAAEELDVAERPVYCLGLCACAPAVMVDGRLYGSVAPEELARLVGALDG